ncbi:MAG: hypothetical protein JSW39_12200, partial [Desulfobacterales bacterium]
DLQSVRGEVICVFNSHVVFDKLRSHKRIDKFCFNNLNAGVSRSWNMGINLAEGDAIFILNADLHLKPVAVERLQTYLFSLEKAVIVGPQGSIVDFQKLQDKRYYQKGGFHQPLRVHAVSGFFFCIHRERFLDNGLMFDVRYSPCFMEEWDMGLQIIRAGLTSYVVPVPDFEHHWGISSPGENANISYFGRVVCRNDIIAENRKKFKQKWFGE